MPSYYSDLYPEFVTQRQIYGYGPGAIHQPNSRRTLEQRDDSGACIPSRQPRGNFHEIDQRQADENNHDGNISGLAKDIGSEGRNEEERDGHPSVRRSAVPAVA